MASAEFVETVKGSFIDRRLPAHSDVKCGAHQTGRAARPRGSRSQFFNPHSRTVACEAGFSRLRKGSADFGSMPMLACKVGEP